MRNAQIRFNTDKYLGFTWNNVHSSVYNVFITNEGDDLRFVNSPSFSNNYASPLFQNTNYFLGTTVENRTITLNLAAYKLTLKQYREMLRWLNIYSIGNLLLDYDKNYGYFVKISSITDGIKNTLEKNKEGEMEYLVTFDVTFETVADFTAISRFRTIVQMTEYVNNETILLDIGEPIFEENGEVEVELGSTSIITDASGEFYFDFILNNRGSLPTPIELDVAFFRGTVKLVELEENISGGFREVDEWLYLSVNIFEEEDVIGFNYSSDSGRVLVNDRLIESVELQGNNLLLTKYAAPNRFIEPGKATRFRLYWTNNLEVTVSFLKRTDVI